MRVLAVFLLLCATWFFWSGHTEPLLLGLGGFSCALVAYLTHRMDVLDAESFPFHLAKGLLLYVPWVLWQILLSNIAVAKLILSPQPKLESHLFRIQLEPKTELGRVILANTITVTPGTLTLDLQEREVLVHALTHAFADADTSAGLNRRVVALEGKS